MTIFRGAAVLVFLGACGGSANLKLAVEPGQPRARAESALKDSNYCRLEDKELVKQSYVRCGIKGFEVGESWVLVDFDKTSSVARVRRMEHFEDFDAATERWNTLVSERKKSLGAESSEARSRLAELGEAPMGAMVWKAWLSKDLDTIIGLYLVRSDDPKDPQVVEVIRSDAGL